MLTVGTTIGGVIVGGIIGLWIGEREGGGDFFNIAPLIYGSIGAVLGAVGGCVLGAVILPHIGVSWH